VSRQLTCFDGYAPFRREGVPIPEDDRVPFVPDRSDGGSGRELSTTHLLSTASPFRGDPVRVLAADLVGEFRERVRVEDLPGLLQMPVHCP
jgi:hypothetical protein